MTLLQVRFMYNVCSKLADSTVSLDGTHDPERAYSQMMFT